MDQNQNNLNTKNNNIQGDSGTSSYQSFNSNIYQNQGNSYNVNDSKTIYSTQHSETLNYNQSINQTNSSLPINSFESGNIDNLSDKKSKKINIGLFIGVAAIVIVVIILVTFFIGNKGIFSGFNNGKNLNGIVYLGGQNGNLVKTSNGTVWEKVELPSSDKVDASKLIMNGINYVNGEYILYARIQGENGGMNNNTVLYRSSDGVKWELMPFPESGTYGRNWMSLDYINNNYYVIHQWGAVNTRELEYGKDIRSTENLFKDDELFKKWDAYIIDYAYGNNKFVAHVEREKKRYEDEDVKTKYFYVSGDGKNFEKNETNISLSKMEYGNGVFVGISSTDQCIYKSEDGINWTKTFNFDEWTLFYGMIYRNNSFYVWYDSSVYISKDGVTWEEFYKNPDNQNISDFECKNGIFVYTSLYSKRDPQTNKYVYSFKIFTSTNGKEWVERTFDHENYDFSMIYILGND